MRPRHPPASPQRPVCLPRRSLPPPAPRAGSPTTPPTSPSSSRTRWRAWSARPSSTTTTAASARTATATQSYINFQPVIPFSISENWNLISRTILPLVWNDGVIPGEDHQFGLGTTTQSFFFSPKQPTAGGLIWGVGPAFLVPTATDDIATNQWGAGITGVALKQAGPWTMGALANHLWSVTGDSDDGDISSTFLQPFLSYTTPKAVSFTLNTESTYDWENEQWSVPINFLVAKMATIGRQRGAVRRRRPLLGRTRPSSARTAGAPAPW